MKSFDRCWLLLRIHVFDEIAVVLCKNHLSKVELMMAEESIQSDPVFIDVDAGHMSTDQYPINVVVSDTPSENNGVLLKGIKVETGCKAERSTSPSAPFVDIQRRRIRCTECSTYTAETEEKMLRHVRKIHRGENPFQCYMCDYSTYNKSLFEEHVRIHQGIKPFKCSHCSYRSASKKNTKKHELIHRPDNPHKCQHCGFIARHLKSLRCHINTEHQTTTDTNKNSPTKSFTVCPLCHRKFDDFELHEKNRQKCPACPKMFCNRYLIKKHMLAAHGDKHRLLKDDFVCAICKWSSNVRPKILLHLIHHPNQPVDENVVDVNVLRQCGIVGQGW